MPKWAEPISVQPKPQIASNRILPHSAGKLKKGITKNSVPMVTWQVEEPRKMVIDIDGKTKRLQALGSENHRH